MAAPGLTATWNDVWLLDGVRTPFADFNGALSAVSPIDLGIKAAREVLARSGVAPSDIGTVIAGNMAQASFDAYMLPRHIGLYAGVPVDTHVRPSPVEALAKIRPAFGGVQTGGNSSAIVDGAAAALVASAGYAEKRGKAPLARIVAGASVGVPPDVMGIGPVPAIRAVLDRAGLALSAIDRFEINEAFGAQVMACSRALGLDDEKLNVNGGAIAIGHPLGATGIRLSVTLARELVRSGTRYGIASACIGGGQGIALLIENPGAVAASPTRES